MSIDYSVKISWDKKENELLACRKCSKKQTLMLDIDSPELSSIECQQCKKTELVVYDDFSWLFSRTTTLKTKVKDLSDREILGEILNQMRIFLPAHIIEHLWNSLTVKHYTRYAGGDFRVNEAHISNSIYSYKNVPVFEKTKHISHENDFTQTVVYSSNAPYNVYFKHYAMRAFINSEIHTTQQAIDKQKNKEIAEIKTAISKLEARLNFLLAD